MSSTVPLTLTNHQSLINQITWHGDDDYGRKIPAGIYFVHIRAHGKLSGVKKVIKVR